MPGGTLADALNAVGLNRYEAAVYNTLIRSPHLTASQIAARSHVPRQRVYDVLAALAHKGLVVETPNGKQRAYTPIDPATALPKLLREYKRQQAHENETRAQTVQDLIARIRPQYLKSNGQTRAEAHAGARSIHDPARLVAELSALLEQAQTRVACFASAEFPPAEIFPAFARAAERVSLQILCASDGAEESPSQEMIRQLARAGAEVRLGVDPLFPFALFDDDAVCLGNTTNAAPTLLLDIQASPLTQFFATAFDGYWSRATPLEALAEKFAPLSASPLTRRASVDARERLLEALHLGAPEPVPACWLGGGIWTINRAGHTFTSLIGHPQAMARALIETYARTGNPIVFVGSGYNIFQLAPFGAKIQFRVVGHLDLAEPLVRDADELDALEVNALAREPAIQTIWEAARIVAAEIGDEVLVAATAWGPFNLAAHILGIENLTRGLYKNPRQVEKALAFATRVIKKFYEPLLAEKVAPLISIADTIAGDHISRAHFTQFALPYLQDIIAYAKAREALVLLHICGTLRDKLDVLAETGADCIALDSRIDLKQAKALFAGKMCVAGNLDPVNVLDHLTAKEVEAAARGCLAAGAPGGGFILMPGCDLPPTVSLDNVRAMLRAAESWR
jgi:uroporphyrinogen decarboxylase